ncbi:hypothetical protein pb186bvf_008464 [Paramecium bursaria]
MQEDATIEHYLKIVTLLTSENKKLKFQNEQYKRIIENQNNGSPRDNSFKKINLISPDNFPKTNKRGRPRKNFQQTGFVRQEVQKRAYKPRAKGNHRPLYFADDGEIQNRPIVQEISVKNKYLPPPGYVPNYQLQNPQIPRYYKTIDTPEDKYSNIESLTKKISIKLPARLNICDPTPLPQQPIEINQILVDEKVEDPFKDL